jgi:pyrroline-5-carboxylate reductase
MTGVTRVAVIGAGRLARALVRHLPSDVDVVVVARHPLTEALPRPSVTVVGAASAIAAVDVIVPAVPGEDVVAALRDAAPSLSDGTVVFNVATDLRTDDVAARFPQLRVIATKVVGQAGELERGSPGAVVVDQADDAEFALAERLLGGLGAVVRLHESVVLDINTAVAEEMARAVSAARSRLAPMNLPAEVVDAALGTMAVGALRAIATGTAGPFLRRVVERMSGPA